MRRLRILALPILAASSLVACQQSYDEDSQALEDDVVFDAPAAEDAAVDVVEEEASEEPAAPPTDLGDMGDPKSSEESVQPESETLFY